MKHCPTCNETYSGQALKFCRVDGALLIEDTSMTDEASATRILPASETGGVRAIHTDAEKAEGTTSALEAGLGSKAQAAEPKERGSKSSVEFIVSGVERHKLVVLIALVVIAAGIIGILYFRARNSEVALGSIQSIAVLPFVNQNNDPNTEYLSDGVTESIISSLAQLPNLKVMARTTVFRYKGQATDPQRVGKELGVGAVLTGKVFQRGDTLVIRTDLVKASDGSELWGEQYNRKLADVFAVQEEIAREITERLRLRLSGAERRPARQPTQNLKAFQYYMQGRFYASRRTRDDLLTAVNYCEKAIGEDPNYALAYAGLADAYENLGLRGYIAPSEGRLKSEQAARKALALDENLAEAHASLGQAYVTFVPSNFQLGDQELQHAIELSPSLAMAHFYLGNSLNRQGRLDEALEEYLKARELDPLSSVIGRNVAIIYYFKRDYVRALDLLRQANELGPPFSTTWEIGVYVQNRLFTEALAELDKAKRERTKDPILIFDTGMIYAAQARRTEALQVIKELEEMSGPNLSQAHYIAKIYAAMNDKELALSWLERGLAAGAIGAFYKNEPVWDPLRSDPRFADLLRRMGIPQ